MSDCNAPSTPVAVKARFPFATALCSQIKTSSAILPVQIRQVDERFPVARILDKKI